jgi:ElaB/YqjD/DUF883 family membrane-anchored ribosome-binding protein
MPESNWGKNKAKDVAGNVADKAKDIASNVAERAKDAASTVGQKAEDATHAVGSGMQSLAGTMRDKLPQGGVLGAASSTVASGLENTGKYLQAEGLKGIADDVTEVIRRNPLPAILIGIGLGFLLARATSRS